MIQLQDKYSCSGCGACEQRCSKQCITMLPDDEGFLYPVVEETKCIECGLCIKVCHELHPQSEREPQIVYAAINNDEATRMVSSSGGIFYLLAEKTIGEGGVVFGARFDANWQVTLDYAETIEGVKLFMGSKYVQARCGTALADAERFLKTGTKVLFSGTPCQVAGLNQFLRGKKYDNLTTVDFVCHGVPSPKVWSHYLDEVVTSAKRIDDIKFRDKGNGWKKFNFVLSSGVQKKTVILSSGHQQNHYMRAFLQDMILRPSCYDCKAKCGCSHSDLTIADFWGIQRVVPNMDDDKGTSLVMIYTEKGFSALDWDKVRAERSDYETARRYNPAIFQSVKPHPKRDRFFTQLDEADSLVDLINESLRPTLKMRCRRVYNSCKHIVNSMLHFKMGGGNLRIVHDIQKELNIRVSSDATVTSVTFRCKCHGWKSYRMEITLKSTQ